MIPFLLLAACEVTTLSNSWGKAEVYSNCSFGKAVLVSPADSDVLLRSILVTEGGILQVFDSFCAGQEAQCTGARTYVLSPKPATLDVQVTDSEIRVGDLAHGKGIQIARGSVSPLSIASLEGLSDVAITEFPLAAPTSLPWGAGISLSRAWDYLIDLGFRVGGPPQAQPTHVAHISGPAGACKDATASDFFETRGVEILLRDDNAVNSALQTACGH